MSLMGVDIGTTGVKALVFDDNGHLLASSYREYPLIFPFPGAAEVDSSEVISAALDVIKEAASAAGSLDPITAIGIASQGEAFTPVASDGTMLTNGMTSADCRAEAITYKWSADFGVDRLYSITGHTPYPMYSLYKLLWLKCNAADIWEKTWKFMFFEDLLAYTLSGESAVDYSMAARSMLFDVNTKQWSAEILNAIELPESKLPHVVPPGTVVGSLTPQKAQYLGLSDRVRVCVCGHDQPVGALGCGAALPGNASYSIGTVECICPSIDRAIFAPELMAGNLAMYPHVLPCMYTTVAFSTTGGSVLRWARDQLAFKETSEAKSVGADPYDLIIQNASNMPANLILLSHFGPTGTPHFDSKGTGILFGLELSSSREDIYRAVLEGITYEMRWNLAVLENAGIKLLELRAVGGGAKSPKWMQIKADILGIPLTTMKVSEATCMGAAILAGGGIRLLNPSEVQWAVPIKTYIPNREYAGMYDDRFELYKEIYTMSSKARDMLHKLKGNC